MTSTYNEKGGDCRAVILGAVDGDTFEIPAGHIVESITTKKVGTVEGNLSIGANAIFETANLAITHIPTADGNATVTLNTVGKAVALEQANIDVEFQTGCYADGIVSITLDGGTPVDIGVDPSMTTAALVAAAVDAGVFTGYTAIATDDTVNFRKTSGAIASVAITELAEVIPVDFTHKCDTNGVLHFVIDGGTPVEIAMDSTGQNSAAKVATAVDAGTYPGYDTTRDNTTVFFFKEDGWISTLTIDQEQGIIVDIDDPCTFDGGLKVTLDSESPVVVDITSGDTVGDIADKVAAGFYTGYTATVVDTSHVQFTKDDGEIATCAISAERGIIVDITNACTATGALKITVDSGTPVEVEVTSGDTVGDIATAIEGTGVTDYEVVAFDTSHVQFIKIAGEIATVAIAEEMGIVATMVHGADYDGSVAVTLDGSLLDTVLIAHGDNTAVMATKIAGGSYLGYTATVVDGTTVQFMKDDGEISACTLTTVKEKGIIVTVTHVADFDGSIDIALDSGLGTQLITNVSVTHGMSIANVVTAIATKGYAGYYATAISGTQVQFMEDTGEITSIGMAESKEKGILVDILTGNTLDGSIDVTLDGGAPVNIPLTRGLSAANVASAIAAVDYTGVGAGFYAVVDSSTHVEFMRNTGEITTVAMAENKEKGILVEVTHACDTATGVLDVLIDGTLTVEVSVTNPTTVENVVNALVAASPSGYSVTKSDASHALYMRDTGEIATVAITDEDGIKVTVTHIADYDGSINITAGALSPVNIGFNTGDGVNAIATAIAAASASFTGYTVTANAAVVTFMKSSGEIITGDVVIAESKEKGITTTITHGCGTTGTLWVTLDNISPVEIAVTSGNSKNQVATAIAAGSYSGYHAFDLTGSILFMRNSGEIATVAIAEESAILVEFLTPCLTSGNVDVTLDATAPVSIAVARGSITINVTHACTSSGNVGITIDGTLKNVAVLDTDDAAGVAAKIAAANYGADYTAAVVTDTTHVKFTRISAPIATVVVAVNATGVTTTQTALTGETTAALVATAIAAGVYTSYTAVVVDTTFVRFNKTSGQIATVSVNDNSTSVTQNVGPLDVTDTGVVWSIAAKANVTSGVTWSIAAAAAVVTGVTTNVAVKAVVASGATWNINAKADVTSGVTWSIAGKTDVVSGMSWSVAVKADVITGVTWAINSLAPVDTGASWTINALADIDTGVTWDIGDIIEDTTGVTWTIADTVGQSTTTETAEVIRNTSFTGWTTGGTGANVTFTSTSFGNKTNASYTVGGTGATGSMTTTGNGVAGNGIVDSVALGATDAAIKEQTLIGAGVIQSMTADYTGYINIDTTASCDVMVEMQKLTTTEG